MLPQACQKRTSATPSSVAVTIEDDISLDDIEGDDASGDTYIVPNFILAIWDIMWRFPCTPGVAKTVTKARTFRETFRTLSAM